MIFVRINIFLGMGVRACVCLVARELLLFCVCVLLMYVYKCVFIHACICIHLTYASLVLRWNFRTHYLVFHNNSGISSGSESLFG